jgi:hypothetical protein
MPSPFPGMDPYLEDPRFWTEFQYEFLRHMMMLIAPGLSNRYENRMGERCYLVEDTPQQSGFAGQQNERLIEIHGESGLVTLIEVVSPANKRTAGGREAYLNTRKDAIARKANTVEIDLLLQGQPTLSYSREGLPDFDYSVAVTKSTAPDRYEIYTGTIQKRLPKFKLPLASNDRDILIDLQAVLTQVYDRSGFASRIDYRREPVVQLNDAGRRYLDELRQSGKLPPLTAGFESASTHSHIAVAAYYLWLEAGCPHGCAEEHWHRAKMQLAGR